MKGLGFPQGGAPLSITTARCRDRGKKQPEVKELQGTVRCPIKRSKLCALNTFQPPLQVPVLQKELLGVSRTSPVALPNPKPLPLPGRQQATPRPGPGALFTPPERPDFSAHVQIAHLPHAASFTPQGYFYFQPLPCLPVGLPLFNFKTRRARPRFRLMQPAHPCPASGSALRSL